MVEFWGIFVVFSACAAIQLTESRIQHAYRPTSLSASDELSDISNSISDSSKDDSASSSLLQGNMFVDTSITSSDSAQETQRVEHSTVAESTESSVESTTPSTTTPKIRLSLSERREALSVFTDNLMTEYAKHYVGKTRDVIKKIIVELETSTEKSDNLEERLIEIKAILKELDAFDIESDDLDDASDIVHELNDELDEPVNEPPEMVAALRKVGWLDMRHKLHDETVAILDKFSKAFNQFVATLSPWERLTEAGLVELNKRFNKDKTVDQWDLFDEFWTYFE